MMHDRGPLYRARTSITLVGLTAFVATLNDGALYSAVVPVLPYSLVDRSGIAEEDVQFWISTMLVVFGVVIAIGSPVVGWACGRCRSMRGPYLASLFLAFIATLCMCFGRNVWVLVMSRAFLAITSCGIYISGIGMIVQLVNKSERGAWIGFAMSGLSASLVVTPTLSGWLYEHTGYYPVFAMTIGMIALAMLLRLVIIEPDEKVEQQPPDLQDDDQSIDKPESVVAVETNHRNRSCRSPHTAATKPHEQTPLFFNPKKDNIDDNESQTTTPWYRRFLSRQILHTTHLILSSSRLRAALFGALIHTTMITSFDAILPLFVQRTFSWTPSLAGTSFLFLATPSLLSPLAGALSDRIGPKRTASLGFLITLAGLIPLSLVRQSTTLHKAILCTGLCVTGTGLTFVLSPLAADVSAISEELALKHPDNFSHGRGGAFALTFSTFNMVLGVASALGPAMAGGLFHVVGWGVTMGLLAGLCAVAGVVVGFTTGDLGEGGEVQGDEGHRWV